MFNLGGREMKELWKDAQGNDLPEIDREVIVLRNKSHNIDFPFAGFVSFAHRPNPKGFDGKSIATGEVEHYDVQTYGKGGWNQPDVVWWLDLPLPYEGKEGEK